MDEIDRQCDEALLRLRQFVVSLPYDENIVCQVLVELAAELSTNDDVYGDLTSRVDSAVFRVEKMKEIALCQTETH